MLAIPISFVSEHIETLEEIDVEYRELAEESGIKNWGRVSRAAPWLHGCSCSRCCAPSAPQPTFPPFLGAQQQFFYAAAHHDMQAGEQRRLGLATVGACGWEQVEKGARH